MGAPSEAPRPAWLDDAARVDVAIYSAIAATPTPALDQALSKLSRAADYSRLWVASAGLLAVVGGSRGRRAAATGLVSVGVSSAAVNIVGKSLGDRRRPDREAAQVALARQVPMPASSSFPSGHSASAFAFATAVGHVLPEVGAPLRALAALVAYSRVHTGVHYPGDVIVGGLLGTALAQGTARVLAR
jgi:membrane-associated phospholipid phosphatase